MKKQNFNPIIQTSTNYAQFKFINGNRNINQIHLRKLKQSIKETPLLCLIIVNDKFEIIDGQHRFYVLKELGMPINYVMVYGYGVKEVQTLNLNSNNWKKEDFLIGYCKEGMPNYVTFHDFRKLYPQLNFSTCLKLLSGVRHNNTKSIGDGLRIASQDFEKGNLKIPNIKDSHQKANMILEYRPFFAKFSDNTFVCTLLYLFEHPNFNHKEMINKLRIQPTSLVSCKTQMQYILLMEDIFNYHRKNKVSFRH